MIPATDPAQAEYAFECSACRALPGQPCRNTTTGYPRLTAHLARREEPPTCPVCDAPLSYVGATCPDARLAAHRAGEYER